jgi:N-ethylmaleimide reductase
MTSSGYVDTVDPRELSVDGIKAIVEDYVLAARNALRAGFDGVEIHGANVYLIPQFLSTSTNRRQDMYGGTPANRARFLLEVLTAIASVWDHDRIGLKLSPAITGVAAYTATDYVLSWLSDFTPAYLHLRRGYDSNGTPIEMLRDHTFDLFRATFHGTMIGNGGFDPMTASAHIGRGNLDLVSFARHYISNPDLVARIATGYSLAPNDTKTYYKGGSSGYTDYPSMPATG